MDDAVDVIERASSSSRGEGWNVFSAILFLPRLNIKMPENLKYSLPSNCTLNTVLGKMYV
jgi:hypothetical protein